LGFGKFSGQYAFVLLSQYELEREKIRTFQKFLWRDLPGALLPNHPDRLGQGDWYSEDELDILRLSSKNHVDVPVSVHGHRLHLLLSHPTPPVFDGPENRNGRRNHDEIRLWSDYLSVGENANYLIDDAGKSGGLHSENLFVVLGDLNADPVDGDSYNQAIRQLLEHERIHPAVWHDNRVPRSEGGKFQKLRNPPHRGDPAEDTAAWGLRVDYVLPARELKILRGGVFWPNPDETEATWLKPSSDHRLVWVDLKLP
jgi:3-phytase